MTLPIWQHTFRTAIAPLLSINQLENLQIALATDDKRLIQTHTTEPPAILPCANLGCEGACFLAYPFALELGGFAPFDEHPATVSEVEEAFARMCLEIDCRLGETGGVRWFLNFWDDNERGFVRSELLQEILRTLAERLREQDATTV